MSYACGQRGVQIGLRGLVLLVLVVLVLVLPSADSQIKKAVTDSSRRWCLDVVEQSFQQRCGFSAGSIGARPSSWACTPLCASMLLPWVDNCLTCDSVPALNEARDPLKCHIPEESWDGFAEVVYGCSQLEMELYLQSTRVTGCPAAANACRASSICRNQIAGLFHEYYQSCSYGLCENPDAASMEPLTQAVVTCNCETKDAPPARSYHQFVQDCTGPGAPVVIELTLSASIEGIPVGSDARERFKTSFIRDMSTTLKVSSSRIEIKSIEPGSVKVKFKVNHDPDGQPPALSAVRSSMQALVGIPFQVAGLPVLEVGGVRIISGPIERSVAAVSVQLDQEQTLAQLQQAQMVEIDELQRVGEASSPASTSAQPHGGLCMLIVIVSVCINRNVF